MSTGVYTITCTATGKQYVGSAAVSFAKRFAQHRHNLRQGSHRSTYLQRAWDKYGEGTFEFVAVEHTEPQQAVVAEQRWLDRLKPAFNTAKIAGSSLGIKRNFSPAKRAQIGEMRRKINVSKPDRNVGHFTKIVQSAEFRERQSRRLRNAQAAGLYDEANHKGGITRSKRHLVKGDLLTVKEIAAKYGKSVKAVQRRIERGYVGDNIVAPRYARL